MIEEFIADAKCMFGTDSIGLSNTDWICKHTSLRGRPFSTRQYSFQRQIIDDMHPNMDVIKISQVGMTEVQLRKALAFVRRNTGVSLIFTLPDVDMFERVSATRLKPILDNDRVFDTPGGTRTKDIKQVGHSFLYVTAANEKDATSTPADAVFNDEVDLSDQKMLVLFNSRMQNSTLKINQRFSTPTFPGYGIDLSYQSSDKHLYLVKCECCNHWQWPEFDRRFVELIGLPDDIEDFLEIDQSYVDLLDITNSYIKCEKCHRPLNLTNPELRQWVPEYPNRTHARGYVISPFTTDRLGIPYIINQLLRYKEREFVRGFVNTVLGKAYEDGNIRLTHAMIKTCMTGKTATPEIPKDNPVSIGIDMGQTCHISLTDIMHDHAFYWDAVHVDNLFTTVDELRSKYNIVCGACDRHPYTPTADALFKHTDGLIVPVEYRGSKEINVVYTYDENISHVQVDRTLFLDKVMKVIKNQTIKLSGYGIETVLIDHLRNMVRVEEPEKPARWQKLSENDHYFHAFAFSLCGPQITDIVRYKDKSDPRSVVVSGLAKIGGNAMPHLIGTPHSIASGRYSSYIR